MIIIVIFRYVFGGAIKTPNASYVDFLLPGILVMTATFGAILTGVGLSEDLSKGFVDRLRSLGFRPSEPGWRVVAAILVVLGFAYVFSWISAMVALLVRDPETANGIGYVWVMPLTFVSSAFVPTGTMPAGVREVADVNPVSLCVNAVRALMLGGQVAGPLLGTLAWFAGPLVVFAPFAVSRYRALE